MPEERDTADSLEPPDPEFESLFPPDDEPLDDEVFDVTEPADSPPELPVVVPALEPLEDVSVAGASSSNKPDSPAPSRSVANEIGSSDDVCWEAAEDFCLESFFVATV
jgi:hypothetical protein